MFLFNNCVCLTPTEAREIAQKLMELSDLYFDRYYASDSPKVERPAVMANELLTLVKNNG